MKTLSQREVERQQADDAPFKFAQELKANVDDYLKSNPQVRVGVRVVNAVMEITATGKSLAVQMKPDGMSTILVCGITAQGLSHDDVLDAISRFLSYCHLSMTASQVLGFEGGHGAAVSA